MSSVATCSAGAVKHVALIYEVCLNAGIKSSLRLQHKKATMTNWEDRFKVVCQEVTEISQGIYPQAFAGKYEKRTDYMEGWNAAVMDLSRKVRAAVERASSDIDEYRSLLIASGCVHVCEDKLSINLNDAWYWACGDSEEIPIDKLEEVTTLFIKWGSYGLSYWAWQQRNYPTIEFKDVIRIHDFIRKEEEWCIKEPNNSKRAYSDIK